VPATGQGARDLSGTGLIFVEGDLFKKTAKILFQKVEWVGQGLFPSDDDQISRQIKLPSPGPPQFPRTTFQSVSIDRFHPSFYRKADSELVLFDDE